MRIPGTGGHDTLHGTADHDEIYGYGGDDTIYGHEGLDTIFGGDNNDWLYGGSGNDVLLGDNGNDHLYGERDNDWLYGGANDDWLYGGEGTDHLFGGVDNDFLFGGVGADYLYGENGNDWLTGGQGADSLDGGTGSDWAAYEDSDATVFVSLATGRGFGGTAEHDTLTNIENLSGSRFGDLLVGNDQNNQLYGLGDNDTLWGGDGGDHLYGGDGDDTLNGGGNTDRLVAGGSTFSWLEGDVLSGGPGADKFVFSSIDDIGNFTVYSPSVGTVDLITDFNRAEGDQIDLRPIDANETIDGNQDFSTDLVAEGEPFTEPGQISWTHFGGDTLIVLNTDADLFGDATIHVSGWHTPDASWFV
jgi:Ca2+-binding RTX toxin-like protein